MPEPRDCGAHLPLEVEIGEGVGSAFAPFEPGASLRLEFASQAGLEAPVSIRCMGVLPEEIDSIDLVLLVDDSPIGESSTSFRSFRCEGEEFARVDTSLPLDVTQHPTIASVAQLDERSAVLRVTIADEDGPLIEDEVEVLLQP